MMLKNECSCIIIERFLPLVHLQSKRFSCSRNKRLIEDKSNKCVLMVSHLIKTQ